MKYDPDVDLDALSDEEKAEYLKMCNHEHYLHRKDPLGSAIFFGDEDELQRFHIANILADKETEEQEHQEQVKMLEYLHLALEQLKTEHPIEYEMVVAYYLSEQKVSYAEMGARLGVTKQAIYYRLKKALAILREHINMHKIEEET